MGLTRTLASLLILLFCACGQSQGELLVRELAPLPELQTYPFHRMSVAELRILAEEARESGELDDAARLLEELVKRMPEDLDALQSLLLISKERDRPFETVRWLYALIEVNPNHAPYYEELARLLVALGNFTLAAEVWQDFFELKTLQAVGEAI